VPSAARLLASAVTGWRGVLGAHRTAKAEEIQMRRNSTEQQLDQLEMATGNQCSESNPCGCSAYYDQGQKKPWRIADDHMSESYATFEEALADAPSWNPATW
jgi:hypothetical protein